MMMISKITTFWRHQTVVKEQKLNIENVHQNGENFYCFLGFTGGQKCIFVVNWEKIWFEPTKKERKWGRESEKEEGIGKNFKNLARYPAG